MEIPKKINYFNIKGWVDSKRKADKPTRVITLDKLKKVGKGLYRVLDDYEKIWKLHADEDGRQYIIRVGGEGAETEERFCIAEEDSAKNSAKTAFKVIRGKHIYIAWECDECESPNLTKYGDKYECDHCHKKYADVLKEEKTAFSKEEIPQYFEKEFADYAVNKMKRQGITVASKELLQIWAAVMDRDTAESFYAWLEKNIPEDEQYSVESNIHTLLRMHPNLIKTHSWQEMLELTQHPKFHYYKNSERQIWANEVPDNSDSLCKCGHSRSSHNKTCYAFGIDNKHYHCDKCECFKFKPKNESEKEKVPWYTRLKKRLSIPEDDIPEAYP